MAQLLLVRLIFVVRAPVSYCCVCAAETIVAGNVYHALPSEPTAASTSVEKLATLPDEVAAAIEQLSLIDEVSTASLYAKDPKRAGKVHLRAGCHGASTLIPLADAARQKRSLCALCKTYQVYASPHPTLFVAVYRTALTRMPN